MAKIKKEIEVIKPEKDKEAEVEAGIEYYKKLDEARKARESKKD